MVPITVGVDGFIQQLVTKSCRPVEENVFRLNKGLTSGAVWDTLEGADYAVKLKLAVTADGLISKFKHWLVIGNAHIVANICCRLWGWSRFRCITVIERNQPAYVQLSQLQFFYMMGRYEVVGPNLHMNTESIWRLETHGSVVEQVIKKLKNDFAAVAVCFLTGDGPNAISNNNRANRKTPKRCSITHSFSEI